MTDHLAAREDVEDCDYPAEVSGAGTREAI